MKLFVYLCSAVLISRCTGYSSGGPVGVCKTLKPGHRVEAQNGSPPFRVTAENTQLTDNSVRVTIDSTGSQQFAGFMLQARNVGDNSIVDGNFVSDVFSKTLKCESDDEVCDINYT